MSAKMKNTSEVNPNKMPQRKRKQHDTLTDHRVASQSSFKFVFNFPVCDFALPC